MNCRFSFLIVTKENMIKIVSVFLFTTSVFAQTNSAFIGKIYDADKKIIIGVKVNV